MKNHDFPLQQGSLDWLCSIYAAINLMYLRGLVADADEAAVPFRRAMDFMQSADGWYLENAICLGIDEKHCAELFNNLSGAEWDVCEGKDCSNRLLRLTQFLDEGAQAVIVSLVCDEEEVGEVIHYTVVTDVGPTHMTIFDSQKKPVEKHGDHLRYDCKDVRLGYLFVMQDK